MPLAVVVVLGEYVLWRGARAVLRRIAQATWIERLRRSLARLPPVAAVALFLVPDTLSHLGFFVSAWLAWIGQDRLGVACYVVTKAVATLIAVWIYQACEPALLRVRWFAAAHGWLTALRLRATERLRGWLRSCKRILFRRWRLGRARAGLRFAAWRRRLAMLLPGGGA
jgi:hypothetical protein